MGACTGIISGRYRRWGGYLEKRIGRARSGQNYCFHLKYTVSRISFCGSTGAPVTVFSGAGKAFLGIFLKKGPNKMPNSSRYSQ